MAIIGKGYKSNTRVDLTLTINGDEDRNKIIKDVLSLFDSKKIDIKYMSIQCEDTHREMTEEDDE